MKNLDQEYDRLHDHIYSLQLKKNQLQQQIKELEDELELAREDRLELARNQLKIQKT